MDLSNKVVWVTGASSGIGEALCFELARRGAKLALTARRAVELKSLAQRLGDYKATCLVKPGDVSDLPGMHRIADEIAGELGAIDFAIANAGTHIESFPEKFDSAQYEFLMNTNYGGMLHCFEAALPHMLCRHCGTLVGMASLAGYRGLPRAAAYGASKSAMIHFMESARFHLERQGIRVTIINPGFVKTPLTDKNDFFMPFLISAERAARYICDGLERERDKISFPPIFATLLEIGRMLPACLYNLIVRGVWAKMNYR
ncbi:MAG: SDR family NAD(P)-dependent oxidoreductase [Oligoflexia bacterium]|nr:SDR family NAD(P)-dependent oxidoreductase [Oligoflexia bacterium]